MVLSSVRVLIALFAVSVLCLSVHSGDPTLQYAHSIIAKYSQDDSLTLEEFNNFVRNFHSEGYNHHRPNAEWCEGVINSTRNASCHQCTSRQMVFHKYAENGVMTAESLVQALPALMLAVESEHCRRLPRTRTGNGTFNEEEEDYVPRKPTTAEVWGYGLGVVFFVMGLSNLGAFMLPLMETAFFQKLLMFLVAVAIGTQAGAGIVVLIPESLHLMYLEETKDDYIWKCVCVLGGIVFVLILERILKIAFHHKKTMKERTVAEISIEAGSTTTITTVATTDSSNEKNGQFSSVTVNGTSNGHSVSTPSLEKVPEALEPAPTKVKQQIQTVAWMVMLGDAIHKFVDGLSVGAAFTENITTGLTLAISVICEELPHELGDVSILLHSGMTMKQALFWNTLAAAMGIPGLIVGVFVGETTSANQWIFAIAGGIFVYVPLADMLPEMGHAFEKALKDGTGALWMCFLQLVGLCLGFGIIILVAAYAGEIQL